MTHLRATMCPKVTSASTTIAKVEPTLAFLKAANAIPRAGTDQTDRVLSRSSLGSLGCWSTNISPTDQASGSVSYRTLADGSRCVEVRGNWHLSSESMHDPAGGLNAAGAKRIVFDATALGAWDSSLVNFVLLAQKSARQTGTAVDLSGLPTGVQRLIRLATTVAEKETGRGAKKGEVFHDIGERTMRATTGAIEMLTFLGEAIIALGRALVGKANYRRFDLFITMQECGALALPIVTLISFLVGMILGFVGAVQLEKFGAGIFVADLVAIAMAREMAPIMTGIVMAGRTGAAFAAQLGTMTVNEEVDALQTLGISPMEFLVLPRMLALILMMPLLVVFADLVGILGGVIVGVGMLDTTLTQYMDQTQHALNLTNIAIGLVKAGIFGVIVALAGCLRGIQSGRSAAAVGIATTSAVVTAIVAIIAIDAVFAFVTNVLKI